MKNNLLLLFLLITQLFYAQSYQDSIRELRVLHFAELMDTASGILTQDEIDHFEGLDYFLIDASYIINAKFTKKKGKRFKMLTTTDRKPVYRQYGFVEFSLNNSNHRLIVYQNMQLIKQKEFKNYLFLPFRDETSSKESYGGGRYLDLKIPSKETIALDFNVCYNPYCAYSVRFSCPIPPIENTLKTEIRAGEKTPKGH
jgi:uncharacterized protein (DUF1684 family)